MVGGPALFPPYWPAALAMVEGLAKPVVDPPRLPTVMLPKFPLDEETSFTTVDCCGVCGCCVIPLMETLA